MAYSRRSSRTPRSRYTLALLLLTAVTLLVLDLPGTGPLDPVRSGLAAVFRPFRAAGNAVFEPLSNGWKGAFGYDEVRDENDELRRQIEELKGQEAEIERLEQDNRDLREQLGLTVEGVPTKSAKVISGPISSFDQTIEIDVGTGDGVKKGMPVITGGGVLGRIKEVKGSSAIVEMLTDPGVSIGIATRDGSLGLVHGQGRERPLRLEVGEEVRLRENDSIYTSGIDRSAFPGDLLVGRISEISDPEDGGARVVTVEPTADLESRYVKVVLREAPR